MLEAKVFLTEIVRYGIDFVERVGRRGNNGELLDELRRHLDKNYIVSEKNIDIILLPIWERIRYELDRGFDNFGTKLIPSANFDIGHLLKKFIERHPNIGMGLE
ncbi:hypothetical protein HYV88_03925 [Candidatus Woesearchaeota archaeon]|nr:hypothetical protein [Candidatus Woesearchaeota archaeon]